MNYPYLWKIEFDLQYAISRLFSWMVKFVLSKPYGIICIKIFQHKNTNDLYTYRLKLWKGVNVVFMATLQMNVILKNELGIWNTPDISFIRPENWLYICTVKNINWTLVKRVPSIKNLLWKSRLTLNNLQNKLKCYLCSVSCTLMSRKLAWT